MSAFNLSPNPAVMIVQAGVFLTAIAVVKKLYLEPYLRVRGRRDAMTTGSKAHADELVDRNNQLTKQITSRVSEAHQSTRQLREELIKSAATNKQKIVSSAEDEAKATVDAMRTQITQDIKAAQAQIPDVVRNVSDTVYREVLN